MFVIVEISRNYVNREVIEGQFDSNIPTVSEKVIWRGLLCR